MSGFSKAVWGVLVEFQVSGLGAVANTPRHHAKRPNHERLQTTLTGQLPLERLAAPAHEEDVNMVQRCGRLLLWRKAC